MTLVLPHPHCHENSHRCKVHDTPWATWLIIIPSCVHRYDSEKKPRGWPSSSKVSDLQSKLLRLELTLNQWDLRRSLMLFPVCVLNSDSAGCNYTLLISVSVSCRNQEVVIEISFETSPKSSALQWLTPEQTSGKQHPYLFSQCQVKGCSETARKLPAHAGLMDKWHKTTYIPIYILLSILLLLNVRFV